MHKSCVNLWLVGRLVGLSNDNLLKGRKGSHPSRIGAIFFLPGLQLLDSVFGLHIENAVFDKCVKYIQHIEILNIVSRISKTDLSSGGSLLRFFCQSVSILSVIRPYFHNPIVLRSTCSLIHFLITLTILLLLLRSVTLSLSSIFHCMVKLDINR